MNRIYDREPIDEVSDRFFLMGNDVGEGFGFAAIVWETFQRNVSTGLT